MPWYVYSILSSVSLVGLYLCIKWLSFKGFPSKQILLFMVGFALIGFFGATTPYLYSIFNSDRFFSFLGAAAFAGIFASIGHWADFEAIGRAPNPGYATSIRNTSILPVTILSVFVFDSSFHLIRLVGVFLILTGIVTLLVEKKTEAEEGKNGQPAKKSWVPQAFIALTGYTLAVLGMKKATLLGFAPPEICLVIYIINFIFFLVICRNELRGYFEDKIRLKFFLPIVLMCAFFAFTLNLLNIKAISLAPNPGYHEAIRNTNVLFITLLAIPLFSASLNKQKMIGIVSTVAGIIVLVI